MGDRGGADGRPRGHLESPCLSLRSFSAAAPVSGTDLFSSLRLDVLVGHRGLRLAAPPRHRESLRSTGQRLPRTRCLGNTRLSGSPRAVRRLDVPSSVPSRPHVLVHLTRLMALRRTCCALLPTFRQGVLRFREVTSLNLDLGRGGARI